MRQRNGQKKQRKMEGVRRRGLLLIAVAVCGLTAATGTALAYWTDHIEASASVGTLNIGISYGEGKPLLPEELSMLPGDIVPFTFLVQNSGQISADVKPVISLHSEKPMQLNASCYEMVTEDGAGPDSQFEASYWNGETAVSDPANETFHTIRYTAKNPVTLAGSVQNDAVLDRDERSGQLLHEQTYTCYLKLHEQTSNELMGSKLEVKVDTYAIQHRNTEGLRDTDDWIGTASTAGTQAQRSEIRGAWKE